MPDRRSPATRATVVLSTSVLLLLPLLTGCSTPSPSSGATQGGNGGTTAQPTTSSAPAASGPDACKLVSESILASTLGTDPGTGTSSPGNGGTGSTTCKYGNAVVVQVSLQADTYLPASIYSPAGVSGAVAPAVGDRGYVAAEAVLVVKGQTGVFVTYTHAATLDQGQALAAAIVGAL